MNHPGFRLSTPGDVFVAVSCLLSFYPTDSLVIILLAPGPGRNELRATAAARHDLGLPEGLHADAAAQVADFAVANNAVAVFAVVVDSTAQQHDPGGRPRVLDAVERALAQRGIAIERVWATRTIQPGAPWWSLHGPVESGTIPAPADSAISSQYTSRGRPTRPSYDDITELVAPDREVVDRVRGVLAARGSVQQPRISDDGLTLSGTDDRAAVAAILARVDDVAAGAAMEPEDLAELAVALRNSTVRACVCGLVSTGRAQAARQLWAVLTRGLPDPDRADAAILLALSAYHAGEGVLADRAATTALHSVPDHPVAQLLLASLRAGTPPDHLAPVVRRGHDIASTLDVDLHH